MESSDIISCDIGVYLGESCDVESNEESYEPSLDEGEVLKLRTGSESVSTICQFHRRIYLTQYTNHQRSCCDPFSRHGAKRATRSLREISLLYAKEHSDLILIPGKKICTPCRKKISQGQASHQADSEEENGNTMLDAVPSEQSQEFEAFEFESPTADISLVNESLSSLGESPLDARKLTQKRYPEDKLTRINDTLRKKLRMTTKSAQPQTEESELMKIKKVHSEMISQLKDKFHETTKRSEQMQILTVLPESWSINKISEEFRVSNYMARAVKKLVKEKGVFSSPNPRPGRPLSDSMIKEITNFYASDEISRLMPGKKDCVSVIVEGKREKIQKRLILCNLKECYEKFKEQCGIKIGFSKFASLRPKNIILPGGSGTHSVCVCAIHQNVKLMLEGSKIGSLPEFRSLIGDGFDGNVTYQHLIAQLTCNPPQPNCFLGRCEQCSVKIEGKNITVKSEELGSKLKNIFDELAIDTVTYKSWVTVDRTNLETLVKSIDDFISVLMEGLLKLKCHSFTAAQQAMFLRELKEGPLDQEAIVICDFAENYSFVLQDEVQGFHWNTSQATIHPFVVYHRFPVGDDKSNSLKEISYVIISDRLKHDTVAVYHFQAMLMRFLKEQFTLTKVFYFSDGAASQYKNRKNFLNIANHKADFGIHAEWHFFATSHGKGPCDGVGGTVKRLAARASLQRPYDDQIQTPIQLFDWAQQNINAIHFAYADAKDIEDTEKSIKDRLDGSKSITGTQKLHAFLAIPNSKVEVMTKEYSLAACHVNERVSLFPSKELIPMEQIQNYVTCEYDGRWWLALVLETTNETKEVKVNFLHPAGPSPSFNFPRREDTLVVPQESILTKVSPTTATGRTYQLSNEEMNEASKCLN